jgi:cysteine desulfurase/selenocysteine lyase
MSYDLGALRRHEFPWAASGDSIYLNHASTGPLPERTVRATEAWARLRATPDRIPQELQFGTLARCRRLVGQLIGADAGEIALTANTTYGVNLAAFSLPLARGDVVLCPDLEFPANVYPWMQLAAQRGVEYRRLQCPDGVLTPELVAREIERGRVRALTVSWVGFANGARVDLEALGALCRDRGVYFVVDAIQGLGPLTLDVRTTHVDIFACGAQKWLLSPWGSGFAYVRRELISALEPHDVSWMSVKNSDDFSRLTDYDLTWRDDARRFEFVTLPYQDFAGLQASLELIEELGAANVAAHTRHLADMIVDWATARGVELVTPANPAHRAGIISLKPPNARDVSARLNAANVVHSFREGAIRLAPYFYNTEEEVSRALELLA